MMSLLIVGMAMMLHEVLLSEFIVDGQHIQYPISQLLFVASCIVTLLSVSLRFSRGNPDSMDGISVVSSKEKQSSRQYLL